jgi:outer membrane protein assembly factor BamB
MIRNVRRLGQSILRDAAVWLTALLLGVFLSECCQAGDWPQILGPRRSGEASDELPIAKWPASGPKVLWTRPLGQGYAGPAVVGTRVIVFHRVESAERVEAFDAATGKSAWTADFEASYGGGVNPDSGPRCVPLVHRGYVYVFGAAGDVHCVELASGKKRWTRAAYQDFDGREGYFGAGSTPIVADGKLIVNIGGDGAGLVAFDLKTGATAWKATDEGASYSSPTSATIDGTEHVVFLTRLNTVSIDPANGDVRFRFPFGKRGTTVNGATPLLLGDRVFVSSSYGVGANLSKFTATTAKKIWANDESMSSQYSTCVHREGYLYGAHGREDYRNGELRCIAVDTGKIKWKEPGFGVAHTILVRDQLLLLGIDGKLRLAEANPARYQELATAQVSSNVTRALPALSNGKLYVRDNSGQNGKLICLDLAR